MKEIKDERVEEIINMYFKLLFKIAYNYTLDAFKAEDIVQEVFLRYARWNDWWCTYRYMDGLCRVWCLGTCGPKPVFCFCGNFNSLVLCCMAT